jgi:hypothetical protein
LGRLIHLLTNRPTYAELVLILILLIIFHWGHLLISYYFI